MQPLRAGDWIRIDAAYPAQMAEKARLIAARRTDVIAVLPDAADAVDELLAVVLAEVAARTDFTVDDIGARMADLSVVTATIRCCPCHRLCRKIFASCNRAMVNKF